MKRLILLFALCLPALLAAQEWEYVSFKNDWVPKLGFQGDIMYVNGWTNKGNGIFVSKDKGFTFEFKGRGPIIYDFLEFNNMMLAAGSWLNITKDSGQTWKSYSLHGSLATPDVIALAKIASFVFAGWGTIQRETNPELNQFPGNNWPNLLDTAFFGFVEQMIVWNDTLFAAQSMKRIIFSPDKGETWDSCNTRVNNVEETRFDCFTINEYYIFSGIDYDGIYRTSDLGDTWESIGKGIVNDTVNCLLSDGANLVAGTQGGVFFSTDNGNSWYPRNYGLDSLIVLALEFHNDEIWIGSNDGLYKMKKDKMFTSVVPSFSIDAISITPNPATDHLEISGVVDEVRVFDVLGIEHPATAWHPSTEGNIRLDVSSFSPGVYFVSVGGRMYKFVKM